MARGPLLLDAAMGTPSAGAGLQLTDDDPVFWNLSRPEIVAEIHRRDVEAGAEVLLTITFGANRSGSAVSAAPPTLVRSTNMPSHSPARRQASAGSCSARSARSLPRNRAPAREQAELPPPPPS